jgi:alpha-beta hydrolase superfamily lysophospholipase
MNEADLAYLAHTRPATPATTALVYLHGIESHGGWFDEAADLLATRGYDVFCIDRRGSGLNREDRGFPSGHVDRFATLLADIEAFVAPLREQYERVYLIGLSWGGKLATAYAVTHPEHIDGLVLITPGLRSIVTVSALEAIGILIDSTFAPKNYYKTPIKPEMFTSTPEFLDKIRRDPRKLDYATARFFMETTRLEPYIDRRMPENRVPILLFLAGQDTIIDNEAVVKVLSRGEEHALKIIEYDDQTHSIQFDAPKRMVDDIVKWITGD